MPTLPNSASTFTLRLPLPSTIHKPPSSRWLIPANETRSPDKLGTDADYSSEWLTHQHRDTLASIVGHPPLLAYLSVADGECQARERFEVIEVSIVGLLCTPPVVADDVSVCYNHAVSHPERRTSRVLEGWEDKREQTETSTNEDPCCIKLYVSHTFPSATLLSSAACGCWIYRACILRTALQP